MKKGPITNSFNSEAQGNGTNEDALPLEFALELFDDLADRSDIAFGYPNDGCYARAHKMCSRMMSMDLSPKKAWAFEGKGFKEWLHVEMPDGKKVEWSFHVAPALSVQMPDGTVQDLVLDPGIFDGPVTLQEWGEVIHAAPENLQIALFGLAPEGHKGTYIPDSPMLNDYADTRAEETMRTYLDWQGIAPRVVFPTRMRKQFCQMQPVLFQQQGKTWVSVGQQKPVMKMQPAFGI